MSFLFEFDKLSLSLGSNANLDKGITRRFYIFYHLCCIFLLIAAAGTKNSFNCHKHALFQNFILSHTRQVQTLKPQTNRWRSRLDHLQASFLCFYLVTHRRKNRDDNRKKNDQPLFISKGFGTLDGRTPGVDDVDVASLTYRLFLILINDLCCCCCSCGACPFQIIFSVVGNSSGGERRVLRTGNGNGPEESREATPRTD